MKKYVILIVIIILALFVSACTTDKNNNITGNTVELNIDAYNWGFTQEPVSIKKGDTVRLTLSSSSGRHGIAIPKFGVATNPIMQGEQQVVEFTATESGEFDYFCNIPCGSGHHGMKGKLVVE